MIMIRMMKILSSIVLISTTHTQLSSAYASICSMTTTTATAFVVAAASQQNQNVRTNLERKNCLLQQHLPFNKNRHFRSGHPSPQQQKRQQQRSLLYSTTAANHNPSENDEEAVGKVISTADLLSIGSGMTFILIDVAFRRLFQYQRIQFPSSLAACGTVFLSLLLILPLLPVRRFDTTATPSQSRISSVSVSDMILSFLQPGAILFAKWLPVFFVPSLITLPLTDSVGTSVEIMKIMIVIIVGFFFTLLTTSYSVLLVRNYNQNISTTASTTSISTTATTPSIPPTLLPPSRPIKTFSDVLFNILCICTAGTGVGTIMSKGNIILTKIFLLSTTLNTFVFGARLPSHIKQLVHPLVTCTTLTWTTMILLSTILPKLTFQSVLQSYKTGKGIGLMTSGPGDLLLFLLGPAVVSLAISMYEKRLLMKRNIIELCTAISISTLGGLYGTALAVRICNIASPFLRLSLLSRNITSPLAMAIASILGADVSIAVSIVVVTGLFGANFGAMILNAFKINDPVARGLGIGAAAHGLGTAAFTNEPDAFPFAAISMALTASAATVAVSIPFIRNSLLQLALGA